MTETEPSVPVPTEAAKRQFFSALLTRLTEQTEHAIARQQQIFAFDQTNWALLCDERERAACQQLMTKFATADKDDRIPPVSFADLDAVTAQVNNVVLKLQKIFAAIDRYGREATGECKNKDGSEATAEQCYAAVLLGSAAQGILPLLLTQAFQNKSGPIYLPEAKSLWFPVTALSRQARLVEVTKLTVADAIIESQKSLLDYWLALQKLKREQKLPSDQDIYHWIAANDITAITLMVDEPTYQATRAYFIEQYATKEKAPHLALIDNISRYLTGLTMAVMLAAHVLPQGQVIAFAAKIVSVAVNFLDIYISNNAQGVALTEVQMRALGLVIYSSKEIDAYLDIQRGYDKLSLENSHRNAVAIVLTVLSIHHIAKYGIEHDLLDFISGFVSMIPVDEVLQPDVDPPPSSWIQAVADAIASIWLWIEPHIPFIN